MPQTTERPLFLAAYPLLAPAQKPPGITISTALWSKAVPNKPQWTGTQFAEQQPDMTGDEAEGEGEPRRNVTLTTTRTVSVEDPDETEAEANAEEETEDEPEHDENGHPKPRTRKRKPHHR